jgi:hypothetical protein
MPLFSGFFSGKASLGTLWKRHLVLFAPAFALLEIWRPCFFLSDDNLSAFFPSLTEIGRHLKEGRSPFYSDYLFGGHFDLLRDISAPWHPVYILSSLLANTPAHFWIMEVVALVLLLFALGGFTVLAWRLREEWNPALPDFYLTFYTFSFLFSTFVLTTGASWINFLCSTSALPWLMLGVMETRLFRATALVALITVHELLGGFLPMTVSIGLCFTGIALALAIRRRSPAPMLAWVAGNLLAVVILIPLFAQSLDGFGHAARGGGVTIAEATRYAMPAGTMACSFFAGNWTDLLAYWHGDAGLKTLQFPYLSTLLACAAAWCIFPALINPARWRFPEKLFLALAGILALLVIRPVWVSAVMHHLPFLRSMRWPFREGLLVLFFLHLFLIVRPLTPWTWLQRGALIVGLLMFLLPLPFIPAPTFNPLALDRAGILSGRSELFWDRVKTRLAPDDEIITVIPDALWWADSKDIPYSYLGTANFPCLFEVRCASGYSASAPADQVPIKIFPWYWFGAFEDAQLPDILAQRPHLVLIRIEQARPLRIVMTKDGVTTDLTPLLTP